jgi:1-acyl-sn-glycerol-3-phosphate acyltransferase
MAGYDLERGSRNMRILPPFPDPRRDTYRTPPDVLRSPWGRLLPPTVAFYLELVLLVIRSWLLRARRPGYWGDPWIRTSREFLRVVEGLGVRVEISGMHHLARQAGPVVVVSNHQSSAEIFLFPCIIFPAHPFTFVAKRSLASYPAFGPHIGASRCILVDRRSPREDLSVVLQEGTRLLQEGVSILLFPQATRAPVFDPDGFNTLGVKLARRARVPVLPVAVSATVWGVGRWPLRDVGSFDPTSRVRIRVGPPVEVTGSGAEAHQRCVQFIGGSLARWSEGHD